MPARIVLSGGIGSGKSTAAVALRDLGAVVISADDVARDVLTPGSEASAAVLALWPEVGVDGAIDRARLGHIVFEDPAELAALETITHPPTRIALGEEIARHPDEVVVVEMPILREWFDAAWIRVVVDAPEGARIERLLEHRPAMKEADIRAVMARQPSRQEWLLAADFVLDNSGSRDGLEEECRRLWERLTTD